ncbi:MAG: hypothetical protein ACRDOK_21195 [Streptosporangiaceae bacterium]
MIVPQVADQLYWASRVTKLCIGTGHDGPTPTAESLLLLCHEGLRGRLPRRSFGRWASQRPGGSWHKVGCDPAAQPSKARRSYVAR